MDQDTKPHNAEQSVDAYAHVGQRLREMRLNNGLTQAQAAKIISVSPQQYQKYEDAQSKCSLNYLIALAGHYNVHINTFLPVDDAPQESTQPETAAQTEIITNEADLLARLVTAFVRLDDAGEKLRLVQLVEAIGTANDKRDGISS